MKHQNQGGDNAASGEDERYDHREGRKRIVNLRF